MRRALVLAGLFAGLFAVAIGLSRICCSANPLTAVRPALTLPSVPGDADDCAIWIHPTEPAKSLVLGNDKSGEEPGLYVYDLAGALLQFVAMSMPSNLDVRYGLTLGGRSVDICAIVEERGCRLRVFAIDPTTRTLRDVSVPGGIHTGIDEKAYGLALYQRPSDGTLYAFVSKRDKDTIYGIRQLRLEDDGTGKVKGTVVRILDGSGILYHVEGMAADDELGFLYASDEEHAVFKYHAAPDAPAEPICTFATGDGIKGDREGIAIYKCPDGTGYLLLSSQGNSTVKVYRREGDNEFLGTVDTLGSHRTDGLDVTPCPAGPQFPKGFLVCHNSRGKNFVLYAWEDVAGSALKVDTTYTPRRKAPAAPAREEP